MRVSVRIQCIRYSVFFADKNVDEKCIVLEITLIIQ